MLKNPKELTSKHTTTDLYGQTNTTEEKQRRHNSGLAKVAVSCSKDRFVVVETFVLLTNICGESPALRVAAKRYGQVKETSQRTDTN